jgi:arsenate reductase-like glutaredoxin family protein
MSKVKLLWSILVKHEIAVDDVKSILRQVDGLKKEAAEYLLDRNPDKETLRLILRFADSHFPRETLTRTVEKLLTGEPSKEELIDIIAGCQGRTRDIFRIDAGDQAWKALMKKNPTLDDLQSAVHNAPQLAEEAWEVILDKNPSNEDLCSIMANIPQLRELAWSKFEQCSPSKAELHWLIRNVEKLADKARNLLEKIRGEK